MQVLDKYKGDSLRIEVQVDQSITDWKILAQFWDNYDNSIKKATDNVSGGGDTQIEITDVTLGKFTVHVRKNETSSFVGDINMEIQITTPVDDQHTIVNEYLRLKDRKINWDVIEDMLLPVNIFTMGINIPQPTIITT